ncbi:RNA-binding protein 42 [Babesia microti strain RI]|uniref:RNA-binding protein 42 n=1 Tax=Babesia microti (strain RI) TaxID=1133968 RepID=I7JE13_BABMR|nr:RNA-binding protein 42 [Babesia microti strain RI]CCF76125.1 RNA-binding protein 42 [Babesia microti strain RI]|eukprot:XP_012650533.1 RNA-binding protein 42 [Babesia microti strain RI]
MGTFSMGGMTYEQGMDADKPSNSRVVRSVAYKKQNLRKAAFQIWCDPTMQEWPKDDFRIFVGNLGNEVTDDMLANAFRKYKSFNKAKVIRVARTGKTRGYGFVSLSSPDDMLSALNEMNHAYVGNRPITVTRSKWKDRCIDSEKNRAAANLTKLVSSDDKNLRKFKKLGKSVTGGKQQYKAPTPNAPQKVFKRIAKPVSNDNYSAHNLLDNI